MTAYKLTNDDAIRILTKLNFSSTYHEDACAELRELLEDCDREAPVSDEDGKRVMDLVILSYDA